MRAEEHTSSSGSRTMLQVSMGTGVSMLQEANPTAPGMAHVHLPGRGRGDGHGPAHEHRGEALGAAGLRREPFFLRL